MSHIKPLFVLLACFVLGPCLGANESNVGLAIRCTNLNLRAGDEIPIEFIITNRGDSDYAYLDRGYDRGGRMEEYQLKAVDETGLAVADPRAKYKGGISGGLCSEKKLAPGASFTKTIALNRWALLKAPGRYQVTGSYYVAHETNSIQSPPISIVVQPRREKELEDYINDLHEQIKRGGSPSELVQKLMFTCHPKIIPVLLETFYLPSSGYWEAEALLYYLPRDEKTKQAIIAAARKHGLASNMQYVLGEYGCTAPEIHPLIERSLAPDNPGTWASGALAAQQYARDDFTPRLMAIATNPASKARSQGIYALALNRTDDSVKALKTLLSDPDKSIRDTAAQAIQTAYNYRGNSQGRPLQPEDFEEKYRRVE